MPVEELPDPDAVTEPMTGIGTYLMLIERQNQLKMNHGTSGRALPADVECAAKAIWPTPDTISDPAAIIPAITTSKLVDVFFIVKSYY